MTLHIVFGEGSLKSHRYRVENEIQKSKEAK